MVRRKASRLTNGDGEPALVLLDLLKRQTKRPGESHQIHPQQSAPQADTAANMNVNRVRAVFGDDASFSRLAMLPLAHSSLYARRIQDGGRRTRKAPPERG